MSKTKKAINFTIASIISAFTLTACGGDYSGNQVQVPAVYYDTMYASQQQQAANQQSCCCACQQGTGTTPTAQQPTTITPTTSPTTVTPVIETVKPSTPTTTKPATPVVKPTVKPTTPAASTASKGRQALDKVLEKISATNAIEAEIEKYEKSLKDGNSIVQGLKFWSKKPGSVKLEITSHSAKSSNVGAKVTYKSGTGKATVRPGGALSFITKEMDQTDSNITSPNEYTPESVDFFSMVKRLSESGYKADITGKTTLNGTEIYLIKVTNAGTNTFESRISHEIIGFDPKTFDVKLWEAYTPASEDAYFRITIKSFKALSDLADSIFKV